MKIYVASSWRNVIQPRIVQRLRNEGWEVYDFRNPEPGNKGFSWSEIDVFWKDWTIDQFIDALSHPIALDGFRSDMDALRAADLVVLVLPCGRSAHSEAGWACGAGKPVLIYAEEPCEPELMYKMFTAVVTTEDELLDWVGGIADSREVEEVAC